MDKIALGGLLDLGDFELGVAVGDIAVVSDLAAHLGVERGAVQHDQHAVLGRARRGEASANSSPSDRCDDLGAGAQGVVAVNWVGSAFSSPKQVGAPPEMSLRASARARHFCSAISHGKRPRPAQPCSAAISGSGRWGSRRCRQLEGVLAGQDRSRTRPSGGSIMSLRMFRPASMVRQRQLLGADDLLDIHRCSRSSG